MANLRDVCRFELSAGGGFPRSMAGSRRFFFLLCANHSMWISPASRLHISCSVLFTTIIFRRSVLASLFRWAVLLCWWTLPISPVTVISLRCTSVRIMRITRSLARFRSGKHPIVLMVILFSSSFHSEYSWLCQGIRCIQYVAFGSSSVFYILMCMFTSNASL